MYAALSVTWNPVIRNYLSRGSFDCNMVCVCVYDACTTYLALDTNFSSVLNEWKSRHTFPMSNAQSMVKRLQKHQPHNKSHIRRFTRRCFIEIHELWTTTRRYKCTHIISLWIVIDSIAFCAGKWCMTLFKMLQRAVTWKHFEQYPNCACTKLKYHTEIHHDMQRVSDCSINALKFHRKISKKPQQNLYFRHL